MANVKISDLQAASRQAITDIATGAENVVNNNNDIQATIDSVAASGGGTVTIPNKGSDYTTTSTVVVKTNVEVNMAKGARLNCAANTITLQIQNDARWAGGTIYNSSQTLPEDTAIVQMASPTHDESFTRFANSGISNATIRGAYRGSQGDWGGIGLHIFSDFGGAPGASNVVQWTRSDNITIYDVVDAIRFECNEDDGELSYTNGNAIVGLGVQNCRNVINFVEGGTGTPALNANIISGVQVQVDSGMQKVINTSLRSVRNMFTNWSVFDWSVGTNGQYAVDFNNDNTDVRSGNRLDIVGLFDTNIRNTLASPGDIIVAQYNP